MPTGEEAPEPPETPQETSEPADIEDVPNDIKVEEVVVKRGKAAAKASAKQDKATKAAAKAAAKQDKVDLKTKIPCPICKKGPYTLHHLMYTHSCTKEARAARSARVEEYALPEVLVPALERPPPSRPLDTPDVEPAPDAVRAAAPPEPPLVHQSAVPPPTSSIRDKLVERRFALDAARRAAHSGPIRRFYGK